LTRDSFVRKTAGVFLLVVVAFSLGFVVQRKRLFPYSVVQFWIDSWEQGFKNWKAPDEAAERAPRNVILLVMDACRADRLSLYGNPRRTSPYMDELATRAVVYDRAYSQAPWTPASMASIFTGTYQSVHQLITSPEDMARREFGILSPELETMAEMFKAQGFRTVAISSQPWISPLTGFDRGFDEFHIIADLSDPHETDRVMQHGLEWVTRNRAERFFMYLHVMNPHDPYEPPPPFDRVWWQRPMPQKFAQTLGWKPRDKWNFMTKILPQPGPNHTTPEDVEYLETMYDSDVTYVDWCVGTMARQIRDMGLLEDTLIVLTGDHGESFNEHGVFGHGDNIHNEQIHVPLILINPRLFPRQRRVEAPVESISLFSTLASLIGSKRSAQLSAQLQGENLLSGPLKGAAYTEGKGVKLLRLQTAEWGLIASDSLSDFQLYDLVNDPGETVNLYTQKPQIAQELARKLVRQYRENLENPSRPQKHTGSLSQSTIDQLKSLGYVD
jgi:arylsulfatase A-like enzyme